MSSVSTDLFLLPTMIVSGDGVIVEANAPMAELLHLSGKELAGRKIASLLADPPEKIERYLQVCGGSRQMMPGKLSWVLRDGEVMEVRCDGAVIQPARPGQPSTVLIRCRLREEAHSQFNLLNEKITALAHEVQARKEIQEQLEQAIKAREGFMAAISHELRNPINALQLTIQGLLRSLSSPHPTTDPAQIVSRLSRAAAQVTRLVKLVENVLDASRLSAGRIELEVEEFDAAALARETIEQFREKPNAPIVNLSAPAVLPLRSDRTRLEQVIVNLLANAEKYGLGKPIDVICEAIEGWMRIAVTDRGIGIAPEDQARIFDRFERAAMGRQYVGFGLGLWIARQIVEAMGGRISVKSSLGEGSTFLVELPRTGYTAEHAVGGQ